MTYFTFTFTSSGVGITTGGTTPTLSGFGTAIGENDGDSGRRFGVRRGPAVTFGCCRGGSGS